MAISNQNKNLLAHSFLMVILLNTLCALRNNQKYIKSFDSRVCSSYSAFHHSKKQQTRHSRRSDLKEAHLREKEHPKKEAWGKQPLKYPNLLVEIYFQNVSSKSCIVHRGSKRQTNPHTTSFLLDYAVERNIQIS